MSPYDRRRIEINRSAAVQARENAASWLADKDKFGESWRVFSLAQAVAAHERALWYEATTKIIEEANAGNAAA